MLKKGKTAFSLFLYSENRVGDARFLKITVIRFNTANYIYIRDKMNYNFYGTVVLILGDLLCEKYCF